MIEDQAAAEPLFTHRDFEGWPLPASPPRSPGPEAEYRERMRRALREAGWASEPATR